MTLGTGATSGALGFLEGSVEGATGELVGAVPRGGAEKIAQERAASLTFAPRSEFGQELVGDISELLGLIPPVIGTAPLMGLRPRGIRQSAKNVLASPRLKRKLIADQIKSGNPNVDFVTKALDDTGNVVTNKTSKRALKVLSKDVGKEKAAQAVSVIENMSDSSKSQVNRMLGIIDRGNKEPIFAQTNRPSDILGDAVANRAKAIARINDTAGKKIGSVASSLKGQNVDLSAPINKFQSTLQDMGVTFSVADDGWVTPDFSRSKFVGGSQKDMTVLVNDLLNKAPDFETAHKLKRQIRDNVDFDSVGPAQLKGDSQRVLKELSSEIDSVLDNTSPAYKKANDSFAKTINLKDQFDNLAGKDIDIFSDLSSKALGGKARRLVSNAESRVRIEQLLNDAESTLGEFGVRFKDDIPSLSHVVTQLENAFKIEPVGSIQGRMQRAGINIAQGISPAGVVAETALQKVFNLSQPDFNKRCEHLDR